MVPPLFEPSALKAFIMKNIEPAKKLAQKFISDQVAYDEALQSLQ
jgi:hypothetical protein